MSIVFSIEFFSGISSQSNQTMQKLLSIFAALLVIGCFMLNNYTTYEALTMPYRAGGYPIPAYLGMNSNLEISLFGGVLAGGFCTLIFWGISRLIGRFTNDRKKVSRNLFLTFAALLACWTLSKNGNRTVLVTSSSERIENFKKSGVIEVLESQGFYKKK